MAAKFIKPHALKDIAKAAGKQWEKSTLDLFDLYVGELAQRIAETHNGGKKRIDTTILAYHGAMPKNTRLPEGK